MHFETFGTLSSSSQLSLCVGLYRSLKTPWPGIAHPTSQSLDVEL